jgi:addiction module RelE/StbE family toxin
MKLVYMHEFVLEFRALDKATQNQLWKKLDELSRQLSGDANGVSHQALRGPQFRGLYKLRIGDYRLIYRIENDATAFITLGHRSEVYE